MIDRPHLFAASGGGFCESKNPVRAVCHRQGKRGPDADAAYEHEKERHTDRDVDQQGAGRSVGADSVDQMGAGKAFQ